MRTARGLITILFVLALLGSSVYAQGPIARFSFDTVGNPGDDTAGSHDAISVSGVTQVSAGVVGMAGAFTNGWMQLPASADLNLYSGDFTLSLFIKSSNLTNRNWFSKANAITHRYGLSSGGTHTDGAGLTFLGNAANGFAYSSSSVFNGVWHHVVGIKRGSTAELWVDGQKEGTGAINATFTDDGAFAIGRDGQCCEFFNGLMDEVKIWNRALSASEIAAEAAPLLGTSTTTISLTASPSSTVTYGTSQTFTATVSSGGSPVTGGSVTFTDTSTGAIFGSNKPLDTGGHASATAPILAAGNHV